MRAAPSRSPERARRASADARARAARRRLTPRTRACSGALRGRSCCANSYYWTTRVFYGATTTAADAKDVLLIQHPCRLPVMPCKCCCSQYVSITDVQNQVEVGTVVEQCWLCVPLFTVKDATGADVFDVHQPTCCCGLCVNCCDRSASCCCRIPFKVYLPGSDKPSGDINKLWKNFFAELATDDDTFRFRGPDVRPIYDSGRLNLGDLDKKAKAAADEAMRDFKETIGMTSTNRYMYDLNRIPQKSWEQGAQLLGATLLINQIFFES